MICVGQRIDDRYGCRCGDFFQSGHIPVADDKQIGPVVEVADDVLQIFLFVESGTWKQNGLTAQKRDALLKRDPCADAGFREK